MTGSSIVKEARVRAGLTQAELARRLGTKQSVVSRWEAGGVSPTLATLSEIAKACGLELQLRLADAQPHDLDLALLSVPDSPGERLDRMVDMMKFVNELRAGIKNR